MSLRCSPPRSATSSSLTILTMCWPGVSDSRTSAPTARSRMRSTKARATLKLTSASSSAMRTSRSPASTSSLLSLPLPEKRLKTSPRRSLRESNIASGAPAAGGQAAAKLGLDGVAAGELRGVAEALLVVGELSQGAAHQVERSAAAHPELLGELGVRPVLVEPEPARLALVLGEQGAIDVEQTLTPNDLGGDVARELIG